MRGDKHAYGAAAVTPRTRSFLRHADVAFAPVHAIQEGNADRRRDVRTVVVLLVRVPVVPETAETAKALVAARLTAENVGEVPAAVRPCSRCWPGSRRRSRSRPSHRTGRSGHASHRPSAPHTPRSPR